MSAGGQGVLAVREATGSAGRTARGSLCNHRARPTRPRTPAQTCACFPPTNLGPAPPDPFRRLCLTCCCRALWLREDLLSSAALWGDLVLTGQPLAAACERPQALAAWLKRRRGAARCGRAL